MINYTLPDFTVNLGLNLFFVRLLRERPEMAREGVAVTSLYGCFPGCVMNGGRTYLRERTSPAAMERTFAIMAEYGLVPRLTFTNSLVSEETLADPYFNDICRAAARFGGEAIVYDDAAGAYLRENYGMPLVLSTTREVADAATFNGLARSFDWIVLSYNVHKDPAVLGALAAPGKAEIMVNEFCVPGCPHRAEHYRHNSADQQDGVLRPFPCKSGRPDFFDHAPNHPVQFTAEEVADTSARFGISAFKIVGRGVAFATVVEALTYYLIRPECPRGGPRAARPRNAPPINAPQRSTLKISEPSTALSPKFFSLRAGKSAIVRV